MILVLNCGSQSIKWKLFDEKLKVVGGNKIKVLNSSEYQAKLEGEMGKIANQDVSLIGHRVVHGGETFKQPTEITEQNLAELEKLNYLASLHNPFNVLGIKVCRSIFKGKSNVAVFDTQFFADLPNYAYTYALPEAIVKEFGFRKYGFHGTSHEYVAQKAAEVVKKPLNKLKIITCHLGGGSSITAINNGKAIDTSMGFTPMDGLVMMTRVGNIDGGIVLDLVKNFSLDKTNHILNYESGINGICGEPDMLKVLELVDNGNEKAKLAFDVFVYAVKKYIGSYYAVLGGCDVLVFTGSIGSGLKQTREAVCKDLEILKKTKVLAIETDEELAIAEKIKNFKL